MASDLVQRLRTCPARERRDAAIELAQSKSEDSLYELRRMAEGRHRKGMRWYNYHDQLAGIEALGMTGSTQALEFLNRLYSSLKSFDSGAPYSTYLTQASGDFPSYQSVGVYVFTFPWARRKLGARLGYFIQVNEPSAEDITVFRRPEKAIQADLKLIFVEEPHSTIQEAVKDLERSTGQRAGIVTIDKMHYYSSPDEERLFGQYRFGSFDLGPNRAASCSPQEFMMR